MNCEPFIVPDWPAPPGVRAAFTLRTGGVSAPPFDSLNTGSHVGDAPDAVAKNRELIRLALDLPAEPAWLEQVHGADVVRLEHGAQTGGPGEAGGPREAGGPSVPAQEGAASASRGAPPRADAAVTHTLGQVCVIQVADCMPVLFAARDGSAVGAAHAGWRGLASGVLEATVRALAVDPAMLVAWMGPAIGQQHFEVGDDVREAFIARDPEAAPAFAPNARGRWQCDLYWLARRRLQALGIQSVQGGGWCTYADSSRFFSYRRDGRCGRMAALIWRE
jgi:YfiH family protein